MMSPTDKPFVSIITPAYNAATYLHTLIKSILEQDYPYYEHIVIDDGSTDDGATVELLAQYPHLRWWRHSNKGQYATQNDGLAAARGDIVTVISADDKYASSSVLSAVVSSWQACPECDLIYGRTQYMNQEEELLPDIELTGHFPIKLLRSYLYIQHCSMFVRKDLIERNHIWFDPNLKYTGDWDWIVRLAAKAQQIRYLSQPLAVVRRHDQQISRTAPSTAVIWEQKRILEIYGGNRAAYLLMRQARQYRAMVLLALYVLKNKGADTLFKDFRFWLSKRLRHGMIHDAAK
jgi:glycosyltransferase involved in cell wall biosynthesis